MPMTIADLVDAIKGHPGDAVVLIDTLHGPLPLRKIDIVYVTEHGKGQVQPAVKRPGILLKPAR